jgi:hypothetical protein
MSDLAKNMTAIELLLPHHFVSHGNYLQMAGEAPHAVFNSK